LGDRTIACGRGSVEILQVQPVGKRVMELGAFANGYGFVAGVQVRSVMPVVGG
jgi:methionyl-tRNA formyltransferase